VFGDEVRGSRQNRKESSSASQGAAFETSQSNGQGRFDKVCIFRGYSRRYIIIGSANCT
jgi:hypothetical protein